MAPEHLGTPVLLVSPIQCGHKEEPSNVFRIIADLHVHLEADAHNLLRHYHCEPRTEKNQSSNDFQRQSLLSPILLGGARHNSWLFEGVSTRLPWKATDVVVV